MDHHYPLASAELSPASSASGSLYSSDSHTPSLESFILARSRVVRFFGLPDPPEPFLASVLSTSRFPPPTTIWTLRDDRMRSTVWVFFKSHDEACTALSLSGLFAHLTLAPALEHDLEPFNKLRRVELDINKTEPAHRPQMLHIPAVHAGIQISRFSPDNASRHDFIISSNPPNPRTSFRLGDWICPLSKCAAHNFGRNLVCIGCGAARSSHHMPPPSHPLASPRFASSPSSQASFSPTSMYSPTSPAIPPLPPSPGAPTKSGHPLLTPSGHAFAVGGRVQNVSKDPLSPCIMYWPENEPFPEQGQIRPSGLVGIPQPPILNTGNRGPISHQPGDWICQKCNYLNWRRRKVCQTCLPYAEGNGDSLSATVKAERIARLTSVLSQTPIQAPQRSHSMTPPQVHRPFINTSPPHVHTHARGQVHRSQSHFELGSQYVARPIYQTCGHLHAPAPLLPSFLQDIVQSPTLSPVSTSSADLSLDEYDGPVVTSKGIQLSNIWKMDGEEFSAINRSRKSSHERLNVL